HSRRNPAWRGGEPDCRLLAGRLPVGGRIPPAAGGACHPADRHVRREPRKAGLMHLSMTRTGPRQASTMHTAIIAAVVLALAFAAIPLLDNYSLYVVSLICVYAIFATGYNLLMGYAGQFDVGQAAFLALGAYGSAVMQSRFGVPVLVSVFIGAGIAVLAGLAIGVIVLRLRHFYLALVTLAFSQTVVLALSLWRDVTRGFQGMPVESVNLFGLGRNISAYIVIVTATVILITLAYNLVR